MNASDPSGHIACWDNNYGSACFKKENNPYGFKDSGFNDVPGENVRLTEGGWKAKEYYQWARSNAGWWNNYTKDTLNYETFLGLWALYEAGGDRGIQMYKIRDAIGYQLFMEAVKNGYKGTDSKSPYCTGNICVNGMFNLMGGPQQGDYLDTRFGSLDPNSTGNSPVDSIYHTDGVKVESLGPADDALWGSYLGSSIYSSVAVYRAGTHGGNIPYYWGNPFFPAYSEYFHVTNMDGVEIWNNQ